MGETFNPALSEPPPCMCKFIELVKTIPFSLVLNTVARGSLSGINPPALEIPSIKLDPLRIPKMN
jgi:hypothetical protein